jgi:hypothetical protein
MAGTEHSRGELFRIATELGWRSGGTSGKGYEKLLCPCGAHKVWIHKTPSDPNYYRHTIKWIRRQVCEVARPELG